MRIPQYGRQNREPNNYDDIRNAVLYKKEDLIRGYLKSHREMLLLVAKEGIRIDPSYIATICPEIVNDIINHVVSTNNECDPIDCHVPEVILRLSTIPGVDATVLKDTFFNSCRIFSLQTALEGIDQFGITEVESFMMTFGVNTHNCKNLIDLSSYFPDLNQFNWIAKFHEMKDYDGLATMVAKERFALIHVDDIFFQELYNSSIKVVTDDEINAFLVNWGHFIPLLNLFGDKLKLDRVEDLLIRVDMDNISENFVKVVPGRTAVVDHLLLKKIMHA